ncbi:MAG: LPS-assembly protein LptD [Coxiella-like endosymbiont]
MKLKKSFFLYCLISILPFFQQVSVAVTTSLIKTTKTTEWKQYTLTKGTLPKFGSHQRYQQHIADILGWVSTTDHPHLLCSGYFKEPSILSEFPHLAFIKKKSTIITAAGPSIVTAHGVSILREVIITQSGRIVKADTAYIYRDTKSGQIAKIILVGHIHLHEAGKLIIADHGILILFPKTAILTNAAYRVYNDMSFIHKFDYSFNGWGVAKHATRNKSGVITLRHATYSTCDPTHPAWWMNASTIILDKQTHRGKAYNTLIRFEGVPILYFPYYNFPIDHRRKTGFLTPKLGYSSYSGRTFSLPFYWNMAPNYDLTLTFEIMTQRGLNMGALLRFLSERSKGSIYLNYLPNDIEFQKFREDTISKHLPILSNNLLIVPYVNQLQRAKNQRGFLAMDDTILFNSEWSSHVILNYVTDPYYFQDLGWQLGIDSAANQLLNKIDLQYSGLHSQFNVLLQAYQTLHLIAQSDNPPFDQYLRLPDFNMKGYYPDIVHDMDFNFNIEIVNFKYRSDFTPKHPIGQRFHMRSGVSFPIYFALGHFIPQIWWDAIGYNLTHLQPGQLHTASRVLPIFDIDSRLYFNNYLKIGSHSFIQTLEPRFFYLYVPYQNQERLPNFDTVLLPFSFEQLFAVNQYTGDDRIQNANQVTFTLTSNLLDTNSGDAILSANTGFIYYIKNQRVCLDKCCTLPKKYYFSDIVAKLVFRPILHWSLSGSLAWDPYLGKTNNTSVTLTYQNWGKYIGVSYVFVGQKRNYITLTPAIPQGNLFKQNIGQFIFSAAWSVFKRWNTTSYWNYNIGQDHIDNYSIGVQYDTCCWALSFITQRSYIGSRLGIKSNLQNVYDTNCFIQFRLKGLGDFGASSISSSGIYNMINNRPFRLREAG